MSSRPESKLKPHWFQILLSLADRDRHGLEIMESVLERTRGETHLWPGMLYGSLRQMSASGLIREKKAREATKTAGGSPRYYGITASGRRACTAYARRLESFVNEARDKKLLKGQVR